MSDTKKHATVKNFINGKFQKNSQPALDVLNPAIAIGDVISV